MIQTMDWRDLVEEDLPEEQWLVKSVIPSGGRMLLFGDTGVGKSLVALTLATAVANGVPFLAKYPARRRRVAYFSTNDMVLSEWQERVRRADAAAGPPRDNFVFIYSDDNPDITGVAAQKAPPSWVQKVRDFRPGLLVVDVVAETHLLVHNDNASPGLVMGAWKRVVGPSCSILFVHHERKPSTHPDAINDPKHRYSGPHEWLGLCSSGAEVWEREGTGVRGVNFVKMRNVPQPWPNYPITVHPETLLVSLGDDAWMRAWRLLEHGQDPEVVAKAVASASFSGARARALVRDIIDVIEAQAEMEGEEG